MPLHNADVMMKKMVRKKKASGNMRNAYEAKRANLRG